MFAGGLPAASALETVAPETAVDNVDNSVSAQTQTSPRDGATDSEQSEMNSVDEGQSTDALDADTTTAVDNAGEKQGSPQDSIAPESDTEENNDSDTEQPTPDGAPDAVEDGDNPQDSNATATPDSVAEQEGNATPTETDAEAIQPAAPAGKTDAADNAAEPDSPNDEEEADPAACVSDVGKLGTNMKQDNADGFASVLSIEMKGRQRFQNGTDPMNSSTNYWRYKDFIAANHDVSNIGSASFFDLRRPDVKIDNIDPDPNHRLTFNVSVSMTGVEHRYATQADVPLIWYYELPFDVNDVFGKTDITFIDEVESNGTFQIRPICAPGTGSVAVLTITPEHLQSLLTTDTGEFNNVKMNLSFNIELNPETSHRDSGYVSAYPGLEYPVTLDWSQQMVSRKKRCLAHPMTGKFACAVMFYPREAIRNFTFYDKSNNMVIDTGSIRVVQVTSSDYIAGWYGNRNGLYDMDYHNEIVLAYKLNTGKYERYSGLNAITNKGYVDSDKTAETADWTVTDTDLNNGEENGQPYDFKFSMPVVPAKPFTVEYDVAIPDGTYYNADGKLCHIDENGTEHLVDVTNDAWWTYNDHYRNEIHYTADKLQTLVRGKPYLRKEYKDGYNKLPPNAYQITINNENASVNDGFRYSYLEGYTVHDELQEMILDPTGFKISVDRYLFKETLLDYTKACVDMADARWSCNIANDGKSGTIADNSDKDETGNPKTILMWHERDFTFTVPKGIGYSDLYVQYKVKSDSDAHTCLRRNVAVVQFQDREATKNTTTVNRIEGCDTWWKPYHVSKSNVQTDGWDKAVDGDETALHAQEDHTLIQRNDGEYLKVPWKLEFTPDEKCGADEEITDLTITKDWVNGDSDGNTQHMWYSMDTLDMSVKVYNPETKEWDLIPADAYTISATSKMNSSLPANGDPLPVDFYNKVQRPVFYSTDKYALHQGAPTFYVKFNQPMRGHFKIVYHTLFDRTPDVYVNYARVTYKYNDALFSHEDYDSSYTHSVGLKSYYRYNGGFAVGKAMDVDHYGKTYWNNMASQQGCPSSVWNEFTGRCWRSDWTVWANGSKPWGQPSGTSSGADYWDEGISGAKSLTGQALRVVDNPDPGWKIDLDSVRGYVVSRNINGDTGKSSSTDNVYEIANLKGYISDKSVDYPWYDNDGDMSKPGTFVIDITNVSDLTCNINGETKNCLEATDPQGHVIMKFEYATYASIPFMVEKKLYRYGRTELTNNTVQISIGDSTANSSSHTGNAKIYASENETSMFDKTGENGLSNDNLLHYTLWLNKNAKTTGTKREDYKNPFGGDVSSVTITDTLDSRATFTQDSLTVQLLRAYDMGGQATSFTVLDEHGTPRKNSNGNNRTASMSTSTEISTTPNSLYAWTIVTPISTEVFTDAQTGMSQLKITVPRELTIRQYNKSYKYDDYVKLTLNENWAVQIGYGVNVTGLPNQTIHNLMNHAVLTNSTSYSDDYAVGSVRLPDVGASVSASMNPNVNKVDSHTKLPLQGAKFSLYKLNLTSFYKKNSDNTIQTESDGTPVLLEGSSLTSAAKNYAQNLVDHINDDNYYGLFVDDQMWNGPGDGDNHLISDQTGRVPLPAMDDDELYILREIDPPVGYEQVRGFRYIIRSTYKTAKYQKLLNIIEAINTSPVMEKLPDRQISITVPDSTTKTIPIGNDTVKHALWSKADGEKSSNVDKSSHTLTNPDYLPGAEWRIDTDDPSGKLCNLNPKGENDQDLLACTFYVADNDTRTGLQSDGTSHVPDLDNADGKINIQGLKPNVTYTLTETKAPAGYNAVDESYSFRINPNGDMEWIGDTTPYRHTAISDTGITTEYVVLNWPGAILPNAGSTGPSRIARMLGMMLLVLSAGYTVYLMRKREQSPLSLS